MVRSVELSLPGWPAELAGLRIAALSDIHAGSPHIDRAKLRLVAERVTEARPDLVVLLGDYVNPDVFPEVPPRVSLTIAGHTHGGQVNLPWLGRPIVPSRFGQRYAIGFVEEGGRCLFVTPGIGTSIVPVRFRVPPEISLLTLRVRRE